MFGMGTGVTLPTKSPEKRCDFGLRISDCGLVCSATRALNRNQIFKSISNLKFKISKLSENRIVTISCKSSVQAQPKT